MEIFLVSLGVMLLLAGVCCIMLAIDWESGLVVLLGILIIGASVVSFGFAWGAHENKFQSQCEASGGHVIGDYCMGLYK